MKIIPNLSLKDKNRFPDAEEIGKLLLLGVIEEQFASRSEASIAKEDLAGYIELDCKCVAFFQSSRNASAPL